MNASHSLIEQAKKTFTPNIAPAPFVVSRGEGSYLYDTEEQKYLDFSSGIAVSNLGHCHPAVVRAIEEQIRKVLHTSTMFWNEPAMKLAIKLKEISFADRVFLCNSGTEANEAKLKITRKYFYDQGKPRIEFISFHKSFHGRTFGSLSGTGQEKYWKGFEPLVPGFKFINFNDISALTAITEQTAGVWVEPIQGEGGVHPATIEFMKALRARCDETGALLLADEIQTGLGRTGSMFAMDFYGVRPDLMSIAKGLGGGLPIGALLASEKIGTTMTVGSHATTFGGNPVCAAAALAVIETINNQEFWRGLRERSEFFWTLLKTRIGSNKRVVDIRGRGLMIGIEFKEDITKIFEQLRAQKVLVTRIPPHILRILPPLTASKQEMEIFVDNMSQALKATEA